MACVTENACRPSGVLRKRGTSTQLTGIGISWNGAPQSGNARIGDDLGISIRAARGLSCFSPHGTRIFLALLGANRFSLRTFKLGATSELYPRTNFRRNLRMRRRDLTYSTVLA